MAVICCVKFSKFDVFFHIRDFRLHSCIASSNNMVYVHHSEFKNLTFRQIIIMIVPK